MINYCDPLFKGCTRPPMILGVPMTPIIMIGGAIIMISIWVNIFMMVFIFPVVAIMRAIAKKDDQQFHLLWLKILFRFRYSFENGRFWRSSVYSPFQFKKHI